jgi:thiamine biosynthesis protein ThiS
MNVRINGEEKQIDAGMTIEGLLEALDIRPQGIAVELNRAIVPRGLHRETRLSDGDTVEVVRMTGGG